MNIISRILWWGTCALAWFGKITCKHPSPKWEGNGLTLNGHKEAIAEAFWHCLKCGKRYTTRGHYTGKAAKLENIFQEGAEAFIAGKSVFDNPYRAGMAGTSSFGSEEYHAWRRGFQIEARRFPYDPK